MEENQLITSNQAAKLLHITKKTLFNWERAGKIVARRHPMNNYRLYNKQDIQDLVNKINGNENNGKRNK